MSRRLLVGMFATIGLSLTLACNADLTEPEQSSPLTKTAPAASAAENGIPLTVYGRLNGGGQIREGDWKIGFAAWARGRGMHAPTQWTDYRWEGAEASGHVEVRFHQVSVAAVSGGRFRSTSIDRIVFVGREAPTETCRGAGGIVATGRFNGEPGWSLALFFSDAGNPRSSGVADRVRITLDNPSGTLIYYAVDHPAPDWHPPGEDFPMEGACLGPFRTGLDAGNLKAQFR